MKHINQGCVTDDLKYAWQLDIGMRIFYVINITLYLGQNIVCKDPG